MSHDNRMKAADMAAELLTLKDERTVRFNLPPFPLVGFKDPLKLFVDLDADAVDETIARLVELRAKMDPRRN